MHHPLGVDSGDHLVDVACGSGLAQELARLCGATGTGVASVRLVAVARVRHRGSDLRVGDMHALPGSAATVGVVTSFRAMWGPAPMVRVA